MKKDDFPMKVSISMEKNFSGKIDFPMKVGISMEKNFSGK